MGRSHTFTQRIEYPLGFRIHPVQVFNNEEKGLIETLSEEQSFERLEGPLQNQRLEGSQACITAQQKRQEPLGLGFPQGDKPQLYQVTMD